MIGFSDSSHNIDVDDGKSTTGHVFYLGDSPITWCSQKTRLWHCLLVKLSYGRYGSYKTGDMTPRTFE